LAPVRRPAVAAVFNHANQESIPIDISFAKEAGVLTISHGSKPAIPSCRRTSVAGLLAMPKWAYSGASFSRSSGE